MNLKPQPKSSSLARSPALHSAFDDRRSTIDGGGSSIFPSFRHHERAFTMVEIAICLAVIGFALAAIIGILPLGLSVQRENREETVINQDGNVIPSRFQ